MYKTHFIEGGLEGIKNALDQISEEYSVPLNTLYIDFQDMIESHNSPDNYFHYLNEGCFKEVYTASNFDFVFKFATAENHTEDEIALLEAARYFGVSCFFIPTWFISLNTSIPLWSLESEDDCDQKQTAEYLIIQPRIAKTCSEIYHTIIKFGPKYMLPDEENYIASSFSSPDWIRHLHEAYPDWMVNSLFEFVERFCLWDLHNKNIGYTIQGLPIIIDWMSPHKDEIDELLYL